jgi:hypothetical protein
VLPGGLAVKPRAAALHEALIKRNLSGQGDPLRAMEWVNPYALAVRKTRREARWTLLKTLIHLNWGATKSMT